MDCPPKELNVTTHLIAPKSFLSLSSTFFAGDNIENDPGADVSGSRKVMAHDNPMRPPPLGAQEVSAEDAPLLVSYGQFFIQSINLCKSDGPRLHRAPWEQIHRDCFGKKETFAVWVSRCGVSPTTPSRPTMDALAAATRALASS